MTKSIYDIYGQLKEMLCGWLEICVDFIEVAKLDKEHDIKKYEMKGIALQKQLEMITEGTDEEVNKALRNKILYEIEHK